MAKFFICALLLYALSGCTNPSNAITTLESNGYTNIDSHWSYYRPWGCSDDDLFKTGFFATSPAGKPISGQVCKGFLKGSTIRID